MGWAIHQAGDRAGPALVAKSTLQGKTGYLSFMTAVTAQIGSWATLACNIGDFSRYSKKPQSALAQVGIVPFLWTFTATFGAIATCCLKETTGKILTTPFGITDMWQLWFCPGFASSLTSSTSKGMGHALSSSFEIGNAEYIYASGTCFGIIVGAAVHVTLSKLFPDRNSLIMEAVYAHEVLAARASAVGQGNDDDISEKEKEGEALTYVVPV
ncbi:hypothetical protein P7C70_g6956, partial [Phenoliferia sp. Uapishka_3]